MKFIEIKDLKNCDELKKLYENSFPLEEQIDFYKLLSGVFENFKLYALYDNGNIVGMAHFLEQDTFIHLNYLAVNKNHQSKGYGSHIILWLKKKYKNKAIVVDIEEIDSSAPNNENRIRRKNFYRRNGFNDGMYCFMWEGVFMTYMNTEKINPEEFMNYIQIIFPTIIDIRKK